MRTDPLPIELAAAWPGLRCTRKKSASEWHAECPRCGESGHDSRQGLPDRFVMRTDGKARGWCRKCHYFAFADAPQHALTTEEIAQLKAARRREQEIRDEERRRRIEAFSDEELFAEYARRMGTEQRRQWETWGIPADWQDWYRLGYTTTRTFEYAGNYFSSPAYTIPIFPCGSNMEAPRPVNMQYRLTQVPEGAGRYRQEPGLPAAAFAARPDLGPEGADGRVIVVEGAKKAAVVHIYAATEFQVLGVPGASSWAGVDTNLGHADEVYVALDPGAERQAARLAKAIGPKAYIVDLPDKPDDFVLAAGEEARPLLTQYMRYARAAR